jgi:hypothetical protein
MKEAVSLRYWNISGVFQAKTGIPIKQQRITVSRWKGRGV